MELFEPILHFFAQRWVHNIIWAGILAIGTAVAAKVASKTLYHLLNRDDNPLPSSSIFINIARAVIWMIGGSFILDNCFGINANALVAALGVGGIAISLGFQDTLSNLIGGMQVTFMGIIKPGDNIEVGGVTGVVQDITWRHTTIEDACGQTIIVPNSNISKNTLVHLMPFGRVAVPVAVKDTSKWASLDALADELTDAPRPRCFPSLALTRSRTCSLARSATLASRAKSSLSSATTAPLSRQPTLASAPSPPSSPKTTAKGTGTIVVVSHRGTMVHIVV